MKLPGFTSGEPAQNTVVAAMYIVVLIVVLAVVLVGTGVPSAITQNGGSGNAATATVSGGSSAQAQTQSQSQSQNSGLATSTSPQSSRGSSDAGSATSTQRVSEQQLQLNLVRDAMANSSRVQLASADIRNNELYVRYSQENMSRYEVVSGVGTVVGAYGGLVTTGASLEAVHGTLIDDTDRTAYTYTVQRSVVEQYNNGEMSDQEYKRRVLNSLNRTNRTSTTTI